MRVRKSALLCASMFSFAVLSACRGDVTQITRVEVLTGPSVLPQCRDGDDNDRDGKVDYPNDPGCTSPDDNTEDSDVPTTTAPPAQPPSNRPGPFRQTGNVDCTVTTVGPGERNIGFSWTASSGAASYVITERYSLNNGPLVLGESREVAATGWTFTRRRTAARYVYTVTAKNSAGFTIWDNVEWTAPCPVMADPAPTPPPIASPSPTPPPGPGPGPGPSPTTPTGNAIRITGPPSSGTGAFGSSPGATGTATAECSTNGGASWGACASPWWYSSDPSKIQINPTSGAMQRYAAGSASICVQWSQTQMTPNACRTY